MSDELERFLALFHEVWSYGVAGINIGEIITALLIFSFFMLLRGFITSMILNRFAKLASKTKTNLDDTLVAAVRTPLQLLPVVLGIFLATSVLTLEGDTADFVANIDRSLIAIAIFWALFNASAPVADLLRTQERFLTPEILSWLARIVRFGFLVIGGAAVLEIWGIAVGPLVAGLGLFGVAVALGAQDLFKNLIAGLFVIGERRFHTGDWIMVDGVVEGTVENIGFRTTTIRRFDKAPVYVPNADLSNHPVTNFSRMTSRRIRWAIGVRYDTSADQLRAIRQQIADFIEQDTRFVRPENTTTFVRLDAFGASSIDIHLYCFTITTNWLDWLEVKEDLLLAIKDIVERNGSDFAFPSRSIYIENAGETAKNPIPHTSLS